MIDQKQLKALDKQYRSVEKARKKNRIGTPVPRGEHREIQGTVTEKLTLPSGGHAIGVSDGNETVYMLVSDAYDQRFEVGDRITVSYVRNMLFSVQKHVPGKDGKPEQPLKREEQTVTVTIRTWGDKCELSDDEIREWYEDRIETLFEPNIGGHEIDVEISRRTIE